MSKLIPPPCLTFLVDPPLHCTTLHYASQGALEPFSAQLLQGYFFIPESSHSIQCTLDFFFFILILLLPLLPCICPAFSSTGCYKLVPASLVLTALIMSPHPPLFPESTPAHYHPFTQRAAAAPSIGSMPPFRHPSLRPPCRFVTILISSSSLFPFLFPSSLFLSLFSPHPLPPRRPHSHPVSSIYLVADFCLRPFVESQINTTLFCTGLGHITIFKPLRSSLLYIFIMGISKTFAAVAALSAVASAAGSSARSAVATYWVGLLKERH
jgi:hypothetical protein